MIEVGVLCIPAEGKQLLPTTCSKSGFQLAGKPVYKELLLLNNYDTVYTNTPTVLTHTWMYMVIVLSNQSLHSMGTSTSVYVYSRIVKVTCRYFIIKLWFKKLNEMFFLYRVQGVPDHD